MNTTTKALMESAILAPSGDNSQPWSFVVKDSRIDIFNLPTRDTSLFNFQQKASIVAHGAAIENIAIAASALGYTAKIRPFPDKANRDLIATIELEESEPKDEPLFPYISKRATNRKKYNYSLLTDEERTSLLNAQQHTGKGEVFLLERPADIQFLSKVVSLNDRMVFENPNLHSFLFDHIRWTEKEAGETGDGMDIKTLELSLPEVLGFRMLRHWSLVNILNKFGLSIVIAKNNQKLSLSASALGAVAVDGNTAEDFLAGGRLVQRVWLEATRSGLSFQPMTGITFLICKALAGDTTGLSPKHVSLIKDADSKIRAAFHLGNKTIVMLFRVGHSDPPTVRSLRLPIERVVKTLHERSDDRN